MAAWATLADARALWPQSVTVPDAVLTDMLEASTARLTPMARAADRAAADAGTPPVNLVHANVYDARTSWTTAQADELAPDQLLSGVYVVTRRSFTGEVMKMLRPPRPAVAR